MLTIVGEAFSDVGGTMYACVFEDAAGFKANSTAKALPPPQLFEIVGEHLHLGEKYQTKTKKVLNLPP